MEFETITDRAFAEPDGQRLSFDGWLPREPGPHPLLVAVHGGGWKGSSRTAYRYLGPYFAASGIALISIDYRLVAGERNRYPAAVDDLRAALGYVRAHAAELRIDPARIALIGDSAGAHLSALVALDGTGGPIRAVVGVYGVYDLAAQWLHDRTERADNISADFLGAQLPENRRLYFDASPLSYATRDRTSTAFFLAWGTHDDIVDAATQSEPFLQALKLAGVYARSAIVRAGHFWLSDPLDEPQSLSLFVAARVLRFLSERL